jgi:hypothetical protein
MLWDFGVRARPETGDAKRIVSWGRRGPDENAHTARLRGPGRPERLRTDATHPDSVSLGHSDLLRCHRLSAARRVSHDGGGRLHINDKVQHFCAYLALSSLPVIGFRDRRRGIVAGLSMFVLGVFLEGGQHFSPGRAVELGDVLANGVSCGALLGLPIRACITIL